MTINMSLNQLNQMTLDECRVALTGCCGARAWVEGMLAAWPFASINQLYETAGNLWWQLGEADWREAFTHHPKIGDLDNLRQKFAQTAHLSEREQAGVQGAQEEILQALARGNATYEAKFGYIFIVCAAGKSAAEMLAILQARLPNDLAEELHVAAEEQRKITFIRLGNWLEEAVDVVRSIAVIVLQRPDGRCALQLRDNKPNIAWPNHWGSFGGGVEEREEPRTAALREIAEELAVALQPEKLRFGRTYFEPQRGRMKLLHVFYYPLSNELEQFVLHEGQRLGWATAVDIQKGVMDGLPIAPHHRQMLLWCLERVSGKQNAK